MVSGIKKSRSVFQKDFMSLEISPLAISYNKVYDVKCKVMMGKMRSFATAVKQLA